MHSYCDYYCCCSLADVVVIVIVVAVAIAVVVVFAFWYVRLVLNSCPPVRVSVNFNLLVISQLPD